MARFGLAPSEEPTIPLITAVFTLASFTLLVYQWDSLRDARSGNQSQPLSETVNRVLHGSFLAALLGCLISVSILPEYLYGKMILGGSLIAFYFLPFRGLHRIMDRWLLVRWLFLSTLIAGAGLSIAGPQQGPLSALILIVPLIMGNLLVCDYRDQDEDLRDPQRKALGTDRKSTGALLTLILGVALVSPLILSKFLGIHPGPWILANLAGFFLLWLACLQDQWPGRLTLLADLALIVAGAILGVCQANSV